ncbi:BTAD domain-containing putative transcriptional regulator [Streptomyces sp. NPDC101118]|uniref:AfsR/SARP family transcriptional regulator n=1 Tax=Streptomyces sp. NPDC101118 TaxID=3366109 RepID=UPI0038286D18
MSAEQSLSACPPASSASPEAEAAGGYAPKYLVLGPLELRRGGLPCTPTPLKHRALLALLLLHANRPASVHALVDGLWGGRPPRAAVATLQMYVSALRRILDPAHRLGGGDARRHPVLRTSGAGYLMAVAPGELDLDLFRTRAALGRELLAGGDCAAAGAVFRSALALWRGLPLGDLGQACLPPHYAVRLSEERLAVLYDRIGADLCAGRAREVAGELRELCARHPSYEGFREQLVLALAGTGHRADVLPGGPHPAPPGHERCRDAPVRRTAVPG